VPASAPLVQDFADFWMELYGVEPNPGPATAPPQAAARSSGKSQRKAAALQPHSSDASFTPRQGQFLAFIHLYRKLHRQGPAPLDLVKFFRVTPPSAHGMVVKLEELGLITREPGVARSARVAIPVDGIPDLEEVEGPPW